MLYRKNNDVKQKVASMIEDIRKPINVKRFYNHNNIAFNVSCYEKPLEDMITAFSEEAENKKIKQLPLTELCQLVKEELESVMKSL